MRIALKMIGLLALIAVVSTTAVIGQDKKDKTKAKQLPSNFAKLGLSDDQKKKVHAIQDEYGDKIAALAKQLEELKNKQREETYAVLTDDQKEQLKKILTEKVGAPSKSPDNKKPDDKKPDDKKPDDKKPTDK
jgi:hypothetical protein